MADATETTQSTFLAEALESHRKPADKVRLATLFYLQVERILLKAEPTAAEMTFVNKVMENNAITLGAVERGDFGAFAQEVAKAEYPDFDSPKFTQ